MAKKKEEEFRPYKDIRKEIFEQYPDVKKEADKLAKKEQESRVQIAKWIEVDFDKEFKKAKKKDKKLGKQEKRE